MALLIPQPTWIEVAPHPPKTIEEKVHRDENSPG
jgi:hypothetical protein